MIHFDNLTILALAVGNGSLSAAIRMLNITPAAASVTVKRSETELGVRLLVRSTHSLALTQEGGHYLQHTHRTLVDPQAGQDAPALGRQAIGSGMSLSIPSDLRRSVLTGWLDDFLTEHPAVAPQVHIGDRSVDMFRQRVDAAVRYGEPRDPSLVTLSLAPDNRHVLYAVPVYFARHGVPKTPDDPHQYNCLLLALSDTTHSQWTFHGASGNGQAYVMRVTGNRIADDGELVRRRAVVGRGITYKSQLDVLADLHAGRLQTVLIDWRGEAAPLHLIYTHHLALSPTLIRLHDFLQERIAGYLTDA